MGWGEPGTQQGSCPEIFKVLGTCLAFKADGASLCPVCTDRLGKSPCSGVGVTDDSGMEDKRTRMTSGLVIAVLQMNLLYLPEHKLLQTRLTSGLARRAWLLKGILHRAGCGSPHAPVAGGTQGVR